MPIAALPSPASGHPEGHVAVVAAHVGLTVERTLPTVAGAPRAVVAGTLADGSRAVLKVATEPLAGEAEMLRRFAAAGVACVDVLAVAAAPVAWLLTRYVDGGPVADAPSFVAEVAEVAARIRQVAPLPGALDTTDRLSRDVRWAAGRLTALGYRVDGDRVAARVASLRTSGTVHGDLLPKNAVHAPSGLVLLDPHVAVGAAAFDVGHWIGKACAEESDTGVLLDAAVDADRRLRRDDVAAVAAATRLWCAAALLHGHARDRAVETAAAMTT